MIRELKAAGTTVFLPTHDMAEAEGLCDRVGILDEGHLIACDTPLALRLRFARNRVVVQTRSRGVVETTKDAEGARVLGELMAGDVQDAEFGAFMTGMLLTMSLCMAVGMVFTLTVVSGIAEEKEKHTLRTLMLANVSAGQIVVARSFVTLVLTAVVEAACFFVAGAPLEYFGPYMAIGVVGALPILFFALVMGLAARDQMTASLYGVPLVLLAVLPMMGMASSAMGEVARFAPTGGMVELLNLLLAGDLWTGDAVMPPVLLAAWTVLGVVVFALLFKRLARQLRGR